MKKTVKYLVPIIIFLTIVTGCKSEKELEEERIWKEREELAETVTNKEPVIEQEDGWYYSLEVWTMRDAKIKYSFGACNLKYETLEDYNVLVFDEKGKEIDKIPTFPTFGVSQKKKNPNGMTESEESTKFNNFLEEKAQYHELEKDVIADFTFENFDRSAIEELFDQAKTMKLTKELSKFQLEPCALKKEEKPEDGELVKKK